MASSSKAPRWTSALIAVSLGPPGEGCRLDDACLRCFRLQARGGRATAVLGGPVLPPPQTGAVPQMRWSCRRFGLGGNMVNFEYLVPTKVVFGKDAELRVGALAKEAGASRVLVHFGGEFRKEERASRSSRAEPLRGRRGVRGAWRGGTQPSSLACQGGARTRQEGRRRFRSRRRGWLRH